MPPSSHQPPDYIDVAIVGAGMTGCATAYWLHELFGKGAADVVVLDARGCAGGATGRNGGHLWPNPASDFERSTIADMMDFLETNGIDCDLRRDGATALDRRQPEVGVVYHEGKDDPESKGDGDDWVLRSQRVSARRHGRQLVGAVVDSDRLLSSLLASGHTTDIIEPFTGATLYSLPTSTEDDIDAVFRQFDAE